MGSPRPRVEACWCLKPNNPPSLTSPHTILVIRPFVPFQAENKTYIESTCRLTSDFWNYHSWLDSTHLSACVSYSPKVWCKVLKKNKDELWVGQNPNQTRKNYGEKSPTMWNETESAREVTSTPWHVDSSMQGLPALIEATQRVNEWAPPWITGRAGVTTL